MKNNDPQKSEITKDHHPPQYEAKGEIPKSEAQNEPTSLDKPTTAQLATLATMIAIHRDDYAPSEVVQSAMRIWNAAAEINDVQRREREVVEKLFNATPTEWHQLWGGAQPTRDYLSEGFQERFLDLKFPLSKVLKELFRGKSETTKSRAKKFISLVKSDEYLLERFSSLFPRLFPRNVTDTHIIEAATAGRALDSDTCRKLAEARQQQIHDKRQAAGRSRHGKKNRVRN